MALSHLPVAPLHIIIQGNYQVQVPLRLSLLRSPTRRTSLRRISNLSSLSRSNSPHSKTLMKDPKYPPLPPKWKISSGSIINPKSTKPGINQMIPTSLLPESITHPSLSSKWVISTPSWSSTNKWAKGSLSNGNNKDFSVAISMEISKSGKTSKLTLSSFIINHPMFKTQNGSVKTLLFLLVMMDSWTSGI